MQSLPLQRLHIQLTPACEKQASLHCPEDHCAIRFGPDCPSSTCAEPAEASSVPVPSTLLPRASLHGAAVAGMRVSGGAALQKAAQGPSGLQGIWHDKDHHHGLMVSAAPAADSLHTSTLITSLLFGPKQLNQNWHEGVVVSTAVVADKTNVAFIFKTIQGPSVLPGVGHTPEPALFGIMCFYTTEAP